MAPVRSKKRAERTSGAQDDAAGTTNKRSPTDQKRGPWNQGEDSRLINLVAHWGVGKWVEISADVCGRSPKQCRERWHQNLDPNLNHSPINETEGMFIEAQVSVIGKKWADIARMLERRSDNAVKNWWNGGNNRRRRIEENARKAASLIPPTQGRYQVLPPPPRPASHQAPSHYPTQPAAPNMLPPPLARHNPYQLPAIQVPRSTFPESNLVSPAAPSLVSDHSDNETSAANSPAQQNATHTRPQSQYTNGPYGHGYPGTQPPSPAVIQPHPTNNPRGDDSSHQIRFGYPSQPKEPARNEFVPMNRPAPQSFRLPSFSEGFMQRYPPASAPQPPRTPIFRDESLRLPPLQNANVAAAERRDGPERRH